MFWYFKRRVWLYDTCNICKTVRFWISNAFIDVIYVVDGGHFTLCPSSIRQVGELSFLLTFGTDNIITSNLYGSAIVFACFKVPFKMFLFTYFQKVHYLISIFSKRFCWFFLGSIFFLYYCILKFVSNNDRFLYFFSNSKLRFNLFIFPYQVNFFIQSRIE